MKPQVSALLEAWDAFREAPIGPESKRLRALYEARLEDTAQDLKVDKDLLARLVRLKHERWVRANLPPGFPKKLAK